MSERADALARSLRALGDLLWIATVTRQTRSFTFARLMALAHRTPRFCPGTFSFPFGRVRYVDARSLTWQFPEIFADRIYDTGNLGEAPFIIDCGGNIGLSVIWFRQRYPRARLLVFEADPNVAECLEFNVNHLGLGDVKIVRAAVCGESGTVGFLPDGADGGYVSDRGISVPAVRLSEYIRETVDLLKMDIEGSEFTVVTDLCMSGRITAVRNIICELHGRHMNQTDIGPLFTHLTDAGFRLAVRWAACAEITGPSEPTPFPSVPTGKYLLHLYAWRP